ncbi:MAG: hypothetical protein ACOYLF_16195, partial [Blastocatellia bacterium]
IINVGEYFTSHYLDITFAKDIRELGDRWRDEGSRAVPRRLQALGPQWFRVKSLALDEPHPERRTAAEFRAWHARLLEALGYGELTACDLPVEGGQRFVPALGRLQRYNQPWLVICESAFTLPDGALRDGQPAEDPLGFLPDGARLVDRESHALIGGDWSRAIGRVLTEEEAPRWLLLLAGHRVLLIDRQTWAQGRYLAFDLDDAFGRREHETFNQMAALIAAETLCPDGDSEVVLLDRLEEQSHRFAHGVTEKLQIAVREAIELIVNEWARDRVERARQSLLRWQPHEIRTAGRHAGQLDLLDDGSAPITAEHLKHEALTFVYRLLFCLYAEARGGELEILPIDDDAYRHGYSLEALRDLELVPLTATTENGAYFHEHLKRLFQLIHQGFEPATATQLALEMSDDSRTFEIRPLTATLFAPESTPLLNHARLSNRCLQRVIRYLSLSVDERSRSTGRVNYAELGINQLGAVYEGLLSYQGMFADRELIHVKRAGSGSFSDKKTPTWFVPRERLDEFTGDEIERLESGAPRIYRKGEFILHLNGIDREQSASYYTPEPLTRSLVEESLRELLRDFGPADADRILDLRICEPAMGSGAFLNEAAGQLAERYLELKQRQLGESIEPARYADELRRVKHFITTRNVYGVDLNATAVELGALSLWLGSIHRLLQSRGENGERERFRPGATPWFGLRLRAGNSLIGARRAVWSADQLRTAAHVADALPRQLAPGEPRGPREIYHFLVFDEEMVPTSNDRLMRQFFPESCATAKLWQKNQVRPRWSDAEIAEASAISDLIDRHWAAYATQRDEALTRTACTATVWPLPATSPAAIAPGPSLDDQERTRETLESTSGSFQRLKLAMDTWCALWFWPLDRTAELPSREAFLTAIRLLLGDQAPERSQWPMFDARLGINTEILIRAAADSLPDTRTLAAAVPWLGAAQRLASRENFHHWELVFPEVLGPLAEGGGFDLIVGNPPWLKAGWTDAATLCELEPKLGVREARSADFNAARPGILSDQAARAFYADQFRTIEGSSAVLNSRRLYPELAGIQTNLYKNFIVRSWGVLKPQGIASLLHPEGIYDDARGGKLRAAIYPRLVAHYGHINEMQLFADVDHHTGYSINIYKGRVGEVEFR